MEKNLITAKESTVPDLVSDYLCEFMKRNKEGPFLDYYPMTLPHWPFVQD